VDKQRKITDEREARRCLAAARAAGGTVGLWARANGIDGRSLRGSTRIALGASHLGLGMLTRRPQTRLLSVVQLWFDDVESCPGVSALEHLN
jgi:hypothetical protein